MSLNFATDAELRALVQQHARRDGEPFVPVVYHNVEGDSIEFVFSDEEYYSERLDGFVTVFVGEDTGQIVGSVLKGVSTRIRRMMEQRNKVNVEIHNGQRIELAHLFEPDGADDQPARRIVYRRLQKVAEKVHAVAELCSNSN